MTKTTAKTTAKKKAPGKCKGATAGAKAPTIQSLAEGFIAHLESVGKSHGTLFSYGMELRLAVKALGEETPVNSLTTKVMKEFFEGDAVTKTRTGKPKAKPTIDKTRRVLRQALLWALDQSWIAEAPLPEAE